MDRYLRADRERVARHAMCRLGLGEDELELTSEQADPCTCAGWPSTVRGIFECTVDYATGAMRDEEIREFYYADIIMVSLVRTAARSSPA